MTRVGRGIRGAALAAMLAAGALPAAAQRPAPPAQQPFALPRPAERTLPNGLRVVVAGQADVPLATAQLLLRSGAEADPAGLAGLADFTATLAVRGVPLERVARFGRELQETAPAQLKRGEPPATRRRGLPSFWAVCAGQ